MTDILPVKAIQSDDTQIEPDKQQDFIEIRVQLPTESDEIIATPHKNLIDTEQNSLNELA